LFYELRKEEMKKLLFVLLLITVIKGVANAQFFYAQGGLNLSNITNNSSGATEDNAALASFNAGLMARFDVSAIVDIETGLLLTGKGAKAETSFNGGEDYIKSSFNPLYVELPVNLLVNIPLTKSAKLFLNAGPYAAIGVAGKSKVNSQFLGIKLSSEEDIQFNNDDPFTSEQEDASYNKLKRFDYGLNFGGGIDLKKVLIKVNYGLGLTKIGSTEDNNNADDKNKYRVFSVSLGIPFGR